MSDTANGVLLVDKPVGPTSHDVVAKVRHKLGTRKVGHAGTLDPGASGLLMICVGNATRLLEYFTSADKSYTGTVVFGIGTDTDDAAGSVTRQASAAHLTFADLRKAAEAFLGVTMQTVPAYSAVHIDGVRAYELARKGETVALPERKIHVSHFELADFRAEGECCSASFSVTCSKGTYVRALCRDLGERLGVPAHMATLRRTAVGSARLADAVALEAWLACENPEAFLRDPLLYLDGYPIWHPSAGVLSRLANGQTVRCMDELSGAEAGQIVLIVHAGAIAAVGEVQSLEPTLIRPKKVFWKKG
ncbi:tRNA pseudouridine synthase B [Alicyclobacillus hesperidum URH17-3-68]|uniref:tRNA pseudouridine(55) synthase TruB n=1 Tax=Alicyclobacillus hesperidum TaxID=89784 RepID=UPI000281B626|nr:tRNA pseudouridine(55) synthase TruB [Alicyclobacillus hesperidum]EJY55597.1 tRNA pseudouridine synthase B [Alicyclobacillus hesperidum URH17-3-68]